MIFFIYVFKIYNYSLYFLLIDIKRSDKFYSLGGTETRNRSVVVADGEGLTGMFFLFLLTSKNEN